METLPTLMQRCPAPPPGARSHRPVGLSLPPRRLRRSAGHLAEVIGSRAGVMLDTPHIRSAATPFAAARLPSTSDGCICDTCDVRDTFRSTCYLHCTRIWNPYMTRDSLQKLGFAAKIVTPVPISPSGQE